MSFQTLKKYLMAGLLVVVPTWGTWLILSALFRSIEGLLGKLLKGYLQENYFPGLGVLSLFLLLLGVGVLASNLVGRRLLTLWERLLKGVPIVRNVYISIKAIIDTFASQQQRSNLQRVVLVEYPRKGQFAIGFLTGESPEITREWTDQRMLNVFVPTTPNPTSGFLLITREDEVKPLNISIEEGMRMILSGGMYSPGSSPAEGNGATSPTAAETIQEPPVRLPKLTSEQKEGKL